MCLKPETFCKDLPPMAEAAPIKYLHGPRVLKHDQHVLVLSLSESAERSATQGCNVTVLCILMDGANTAK